VTSAELLQLLNAGGVLTLAVLVLIEQRLMRREMGALRQDFAAMLERDRRRDIEGGTPPHGVPVGGHYPGYRAPTRPGGDRDR
jgi:hypothetical protein